MKKTELPSSMRRRVMTTIMLGGATLALPALSDTTYPNRPIRLIVPYPPGGGIDAVGRSYARHLSDILGQAVFVDNRPGAATNIGVGATAKSDPDGYTLGIASTGLVNNPFFGPKPSYDTLSDLAPIGLLSSMPFMIAAGPSLGDANMQEVLERARAKSKSISIGSSLRTQVEVTAHQSGVDLLTVHYKGGAQAVKDAVAGEIDLVFGLLAVLQGNIKAGNLRLLAVADSQRSSLVPDVPTFAEVGIPGYPKPSWAAIVAPTGVPESILSRLNDATRQVTENPEFISLLSDQGIEVNHLSSTQLAQMLREELAESESLFKQMQLQGG